VTRRPPGATVAVAGVLLVLSAAGCSAASEAPAPSGVDVTLLQYRRGQAEGIVQLKVENHRAAAVTVDRVELDADAFRGVGPVRQDATLAPGDQVDLPVHLGTPVCGAVEGTTLFSITGAGLPLTLAAGGEPVDVPVTLTPQRCDAHAIGESKRGYAFGVRLTADGLDEVRLAVEPDAAARRTLQNALLTACGLSP
jgi:hypothetical protein